MRHLDEETMKALLAKDPAVRAELLPHLREPCEVCEQFLAGREGPGLLDGQVDSALLALAPAREAQLDEVGFRRTMRRMRGPRAMPTGASAVVGLAAGLVVVFAVGRAGELAGGEAGLKGVSRISVELSATVVDPANEQVLPLPPDGAVSPGDTVLLRYHATEAGRGLLYVQRGAGRPEPLGSFQLEAGTHDLEVKQGAWGFSLDGEKGRLRLWLVAAPGAQVPDPQVAADVIRGVRDAPALGRAGVELHVRD